MIPRRFHRIFLDEPIPARFEANWTKLKALHPDAEFITWDDSTKLDWMRCKAEFAKATTHAGRSDVLRYAALWEFGGIYLDTDVEPLRAFDDLFASDRAFAGWEDANMICPTVMGAPPRHRAVGALLDRLPAWMAKRPDAPPNQQTGPHLLTALWRRRRDVDLLAPVAFYPVHWSAKSMLGGPYPAESYAVHHWAKSWGAQRCDDTTAVLVPWRGGDAARERAWEIARPYLEEIGGRLVTADADPGEWNRSQAINRAAAAAGDWDVAVIADADTVQMAATIVEAVEQAGASGGAVVPWSTRWKLSAEGTERFAVDGIRGWNRRRDMDPLDPTKTTGIPVERRGGTVVVSRRAWDAVGGFDEGFVKWGHEDRAFRLALATLAPGGLSELVATCWHLWHPLAPREVRAGFRANETRYARYEAAYAKQRAMRALLEELRA